MLSLTLLNMLFGGTVILFAAWIGTACLRRSTVRHRVWSLAVVGLLLTPGLAAVLPRIHTSPKRERGGIEVPTVRHPREGGDLEKRFDIPLHSTDQEYYEPSVQEKIEAKTLGPRLRGDDGVIDVFSRGGHAELRSAAKIPWGRCIVGVWLGGVFLGFVSLLLGKLSARILRRQSVPADESWKFLTETVAKKLGIRFRVGIRRSDAVQVPMVVGIWKPTVLLPGEAETWTDSQRRAVLIHELSHVLRRDVFWQTLAGLCTAMYWFHPLVHVAVRKMRNEQESACDDAVLFAGETPSDYARLLVDIAGRVLRKQPIHAVAMARAGSVQQRVDAILETKRNRKPLGKFAAAGLFVAATAVVSATVLCSPFAPPPTANAESQTTKEPGVESVLRRSSRVAESLQDATNPGATASTPIQENPPALENDSTTEGHTVEVDGKKYFIPKGKIGLLRSDTIVLVDKDKYPFETDPSKPKLVRVLDDKGNPVEGITVSRKLDGYPSFSQQTDKNGELRFAYAKNEPPNSLFTVEVLPNSKQDFVPMYKIWRRTGIVDEIPNEIVFRLQKSKTIEGTVVDKEGRPVAGAYVQVVLPREIEFNKATVLRQLDQLTTDKDGRWKSNHAPSDEPSVQVSVTHPNYVDRIDPVLLRNEPGGYVGVPTTPPALSGFSLRTVLERYVRVTGIIVDENGNPVPDVEIQTSFIVLKYGNWSGKTDADGKFVIEKYPPCPAPKDGEGKHPYSVARAMRGLTNVSDCFAL